MLFEALPKIVREPCIPFLVLFTTQNIGVPIVRISNGIHEVTIAQSMMARYEM